MCGGVCGCRQNWEIPGSATRLLLATSVGHVLPTVARIAKALGLTVYSSPQLLDVLDDAGGRRLDRLFQVLARELTAAETDALRVATDPPGEGAAMTARLLTAPTLAVELARRGVTVEVGVLAEAEFWSVYQPIVSLADRSVVAHEALLRGVVDGREVGGGDLFFVAEQAGWLHRMDRIGRESAISGAVPWLGDDDLFINFNPTSIYRPQVCLASTERVVHETGIEPEQLVFEVVESHAIADRGHLVSLAGSPGRRRRRLVEPVAAGRRPARRRQARQATGAGAAGRRRAHGAEGGHRSCPPARRRGRGRGRGDRAARRRGDGTRGRPGSGLAVRPPGPPAAACRRTRGPLAAGQRIPQAVSTGRACSCPRTP
jgi:hypothetical protein